MLIAFHESGYIPMPHIRFYIQVKNPHRRAGHDLHCWYTIFLHSMEIATYRSSIPFSGLLEGSHLPSSIKADSIHSPIRSRELGPAFTIRSTDDGMIENCFDGTLLDFRLLAKTISAFGQFAHTNIFKGFITTKYGRRNGFSHQFQMCTTNSSNNKGASSNSLVYRFLVI